MVGQVSQGEACHYVIRELGKTLSLYYKYARENLIVTNVHVH